MGDGEGKRVLVMGTLSRGPVRETVARVCETVAPLAEVVESDLELPGPVFEGDVDLAIVVGGDGSILKASRALAPRGIPCLGVNTGRLGFLAGFQEQEVGGCLAEVLGGGGRRVQRMMLHVRIDKRDGHHPVETCLNDVAVAQGRNHRMIGVTVTVEHVPACTFHGDGVVVSTPTGSTAYNLAAGGPILSPQMEAVVITPICPHMLTNRSIVIAADMAVSLRPTDELREATCIIDGQVMVPLVTGDVVHVSRSPHMFELVENPARSAFETLSEKLHWGHPPRYGR